MTDIGLMHLRSVSSFRGIRLSGLTHQDPVCYGSGEIAGRWRLWLLTRCEVSQNNIRFELANILFNLSALYSQLAFSVNRTTAEGLKQACNYF